MTEYKLVQMLVSENYRQIFSTLMLQKTHFVLWKYCLNMEILVRLFTVYIQTFTFFIVAGSFI